MIDVEYQDENKNLVKEFSTYDPLKEELNKINSKNADLIFKTAYFPFHIKIQREYKLSDLETKIYGFIQHWTSGGGEFYVSNQRLGEYFGCHKDTVSVAINNLASKKLIRSTHKQLPNGLKMRKLGGIGENAYPLGENAYPLGENTYPPRSKHLPPLGENTYLYKDNKYKDIKEIPPNPQRGNASAGVKVFTPLPELLKTEPEEVAKQNTTTLPPVAVAPSLFDQFWKLYPRHVGKEAASKAWKKISLIEQQKAIDVLPQHRKQPNWLKDDGIFIPHPSTWLNNKRWEDEIIGISKPINQEVKKKNEEEFQKIFSLTRDERVALLKQKQHESTNG